MAQRILTVILNYRTAEMTLRSAHAALRAMQGVEGEIIVVDNDSGDGSFERLHAALDGAGRIRVIQSGRNGGYGAGNNAGIRAGLSGSARPDYIFLLNSDAFPDPDAIAVMRDFLDAHPGAGMVGSHVRGDDGVAHVSCFRFPTILSEFERAARTGPITRLLRRHVVPIDPPAVPTQVDWLAGASLMIRTAVLDQVGLFDETFFLYFEETDLCRRADAAGWTRHYLPGAGVAHIGSVSTGMKRWKRVPRYWFDSRWHYFSKHHGSVGAVAATLAHLAGGAIWGARRLAQRREAATAPHFFRDLVKHMLCRLANAPSAPAAHSRGDRSASQGEVR